MVLCNKMASNVSNQNNLAYRLFLVGLYSYVYFLLCFMLN